jgi:hypothetical protein
LLLAKNERESIADAIRKGRINAMKGVEVTTRNNHVENGESYCDIYLRIGERE